jgi:serine/threonine protein phosphatase PrpC
MELETYGQRIRIREGDAARVKPPTKSEAVQMLIPIGKPGENMQLLFQRHEAGIVIINPGMSRADGSYAAVRLDGSQGAVLSHSSDAAALLGLEKMPGGLTVHISAAKEGDPTVSTGLDISLVSARDRPAISLEVGKIPAVIQDTKIRVEAVPGPDSTSRVLSAEATIAKPGKEAVGMSGDKVYLLANGTAIDMDGMGGHGGDNIAARTAGAAIRDKMMELTPTATVEETAAAMKRAWVSAGEAVRRGRTETNNADMDTVGDVNKICPTPDGKGRTLVTSHIGDTGTYIFNIYSGELTRVGEDEGLTQYKVKGGNMTSRTAYLDEDRHVVIGGAGEINQNNVDKKLKVYKTQLKRGDIVITASDGIKDNMPDTAALRAGINQRLQTEGRNTISTSLQEELVRNNSQLKVWFEGGSTENTVPLAIAQKANEISLAGIEPQHKPDDISIAMLAPRWTEEVTPSTPEQRASSVQTVFNQEQLNSIYSAITSQPDIQRGINSNFVGYLDRNQELRQRAVTSQDLRARAAGRFTSILESIFKTGLWQPGETPSTEQLTTIAGVAVSVESNQNPGMGMPLRTEIADLMYSALAEQADTWMREKQIRIEISKAQQESTLGRMVALLGIDMASMLDKGRQDATTKDTLGFIESAVVRLFGQDPEQYLAFAKNRRDLAVAIGSRLGLWDR